MVTPECSSLTKTWVNVDYGRNDHTLSPLHPPEVDLPLPDVSAGVAEISPRLPPELCDIIIDEAAKVSFHSGRFLRETVLRRLALVCRAWRPRAQLYLFRPVWLRSLESLWKLEAQLSLHSDFLPEIHAIHIVFEDAKGYPVRNLLSAVTTLAQQCGNLRALSLFHIESWSIRPGTPPHVYCIPFDPRSHSPLFRNSFCTITYLSLLGIHYRSDIDFLAFIFSFPALEKLSLEHVFCNSYRRIKEENYILLLKQRKGILGKLRCLTMVYRPIPEPCITHLCPAVYL